MFRCATSAIPYRVLSSAIGRRTSTIEPVVHLTGQQLYSHNHHHHHRYATTLVIADPTSSTTEVAVSTCQAATAAKQIGNDNLTLLVVGGTALPTQIPQGTTKMIHVPFSDDSHSIVPETVASAIVAAVQSDSDITHVIGTSSKFGSTILPRAAAMLGRSQDATPATHYSPLHDVIQIISTDTFIRPIYAGNVLVKVQMKDPIKILSIRPTAFDKAPFIDDSAVATIPTEQLTSVEPFTGSVYVGASNSNASGNQQARPDLSTADIVVTGGRGLGHKDQFQLLEELADALNTNNNVAIGASRAAVDAGMAPNDQQVGQTGKVVAPNLYIAIGVSGAIQHLSGMKDSKTIVAINKDPDAPIFQVADYGLVADLFQAVPELTTKLKELKASAGK